MIAAISLSRLFVGYVVVVALIVAVTLGRTLTVRAASAAYAVLALWLAYSGALGYFGVVSDTTLPIPGVFLLLMPIIAFVAIVLVRSSAGKHLAMRVSLRILIGLQVFRVGVELTLHRLWELGLVPKLMTLAGGNVEILIGFSAPVIALLATAGVADDESPSPGISLVWPRSSTSLPAPC